MVYIKEEPDDRSVFGNISCMSLYTAYCKSKI